MKKVFLGGTCNGSMWRESLIPMLDIDYFNPVVDDCTSECQDREIRERQVCDYCLYVITPKMKGVYSIAEVTADSIKRPEKTLFCLLYEYDGLKLDKSQVKSLDSVARMVERNGAKVFTSLNDVADFLNHGDEK